MQPNLALLVVLAIIGVLAVLSIFWWKHLATSRIKRYRENVELRQQARAAIAAAGRTASAVPSGTQKSASNVAHDSPIRGRARFHNRSGAPSNVSGTNATTAASNAPVVPAPRTPNQSPTKLGPRASGSPQKTGKEDGVTITLDHKSMEEFLRPAGLKWNKKAPAKASPTKTSADREAAQKESPVKASTMKAAPSNEPAAKESPVKTAATKESPNKTSTTAAQAKTSPTKASIAKEPPANASPSKKSPVKSSMVKESSSNTSPTKDSSSKQALVKSTAPSKLSGKQVSFTEKPKASPATASPTKSKKSSSHGSGGYGLFGLLDMGDGHYHDKE